MERSNSNQFTFSYTFKHDLKSTWSVLKDFSKTNRMSDQAIEGWTSQPVFTKCTHSYELGAEFCYYHRKFIKLFVKNTEIMESDNFARVKFEVSSNTQFFPSYDFIYNLYSDPTGSSCTLILEKIFKSDFKMPVREQELYELELFTICTHIEKCIEEEKVLKTQSEEIQISKDFEFVWQSIMKFKEFQKLVPLICDEVEYDGDCLTEHKKVAFKWNSKRQSVVYLNVNQVSKNSDFGVLLFESYDSSPPVPQQKIEWRIEKQDDFNCLLKLTHIYNEIITQESLSYSSQMKRKILQDLKMQIENM